MPASGGRRAAQKQPTAMPAARARAAPTGARPSRARTSPGCAACRGSYHDQERRLVFVHAGIEPASFPNEPERTYLWTRSDRFFEHAQWPDREGAAGPHGRARPHAEHRSTRKSSRTASMSTPAPVFGGPLTAVMLKEGARAGIPARDLEAPIQRIDDARAPRILQQVRALPVHDVGAGQARRRIAERA